MCSYYSFCIICADNPYCVKTAMSHYVKYLNKTLFGSHFPAIIRFGTFIFCKIPQVAKCRLYPTGIGKCRKHITKRQFSKDTVKNAQVCFK